MYLSWNVVIYFSGYFTYNTKHTAKKCTIKTMQALLFLFLDILTCCLGFLNKYIYRVRTTFFFYKENALNTLKNEEKNPNRFVPFLPGTVTEDVRERFFLQKTRLLLF